MAKFISARKWIQIQYRKGQTQCADFAWLEFTVKVKRDQERVMLGFKNNFQRHTPVLIWPFCW